MTPNPLPPGPENAPPAAGVALDALLKWARQCDGLLRCIEDLRRYATDISPGELRGYGSTARRLRDELASLAALSAQEKGAAQ